MSRRKGPARGVKTSRKYTGLSDSDLSDDEMNLMQVFEAILQENATRRNTRRPARNRRAPKRPRSVNNPITPPKKKNETLKNKKKEEKSCEHLISCDSDEEKPDVNISETVATDHFKQIENKVNNFFKSHNLLSEDEDEINPKAANKTCQQTKEFYELSDSDEELNNIIKSTNSEKNALTSISPGPSCSKVENTNRSDELMDIVDKILVNDDSTTDLTNTEPNENWIEMKNKAQDMLGSIDNLLNEIDKNTKTENPKSPEKARPTCPVCLEQLGGDIVMMTTICGHIFCKDCITKVAKTSKNCPTCRKHVNLKKIHAVYM